MRRKPDDLSAPCDHSHALIRETLLQIAAERKRIDPATCGTFFALVETGRALRRHLSRSITDEGLSEAKFCALTVLWRSRPEPLMPAELAYHAGVSRSAMTDVIDQLVADGCVERDHSMSDRRTIGIRLTAAGARVAEQAIGRLMDDTAAVVQDFPALADPRLAELCAAIHDRLARAEFGDPLNG